MRISDWSSDVCSSDLSLRIRALVVAIVHAVAVAVHVGAARGGRGRGDRGGRRRAQRDHHADRGQDVAEPVLAIVVVGIAGECGVAVVVGIDAVGELGTDGDRSEEHTSELQSLMRISYAVFCLKKKKTTRKTQQKND